MVLKFQCSFQVPAFVLAVLGWITSFVALLTPAWQVVYARELEQWVQSGLWLSCQTRPSGMYLCTYTISESDFNFYTSADVEGWRTPPFFAWQRRLLVVYLAGQFAAFIALISFCCSLQAAGRKMSSAVFIGAIAICLLLHVGSSVVFMFFSQLVEYRFYHVSVSGIYEKHRGYSIYLEFFAVFLYFLSLLLAIVHLVQGPKNDYRTSDSEFKFDTFPNAAGPYRQVESYYPRPGSSTSQLDMYESRFAMRELPPIPGRRI